MTTPPDTAKLLEQERRLMKPAGIIALAGLAIFVISIVLQTGIGGDDLDSDAGLLRSYADDGSQLILSRALFGLTFLSFAPALYVLFRAVQARFPTRIRPAMVAFCFIGPVLWAVQAPLLAVGLKDAGDQFVSEEPALEAEAAAQESDTPAGDGAAGQASQQEDQGQGAGDAQEQGQGGADGSGQGAASEGEVTTTPTEEGTTTDSEEGGDADSEEDVVEQRAEEIAEDNGTVTFARALQIPAVLGMLAAMVYIPLWGMRAGLLTRFMGSFGMALGVSLIILPFAQLLLPFWFGVFGLILLGRWIRGRPPAWDEGKAIPWQRPGDQPPDDPDGPIEGSGRDVSDDPQGGQSLGPGEGEGNGAGGPPPQKRKRRR